MPDLLFEVGTEELPASYIPPAIDELKAGAAAALKELGLSFGEAIATGTPRRLTLYVAGLPVAQAARTEEVLGPAEKAAWKDGQPTRAATGFAEKNGVRVEDLIVKDTAKGRYVAAVKRVEGRRTVELLAELLPDLVRGLSFPKSMRWPQAGGRATFARPIRRLLALFGRDVIPVEIAGVRASRATVGHPFLSEPGELPLDGADYRAYAKLLKGHGVIVDRNERRFAVQRALEQLFEQHAAPFTRTELVEEVTDLVEGPEVMEGGFDERYLSLPRAVIEAAMTDHQRYFPIIRADGRVLPRFAFVANRPKDRAATIREGNERVLRARLEDATFYFHEDRKRMLPVRVPALRGIVFQEKLGTMLDKTNRLVALVEALGELAEELGRRVPLPGGAAAKAARRAAELSKTDLTTELVKEFPELQGTIGAEYARTCEDEAVAVAIREHYLPRFAGDELPASPAGTVLALADRLDNLCGFFAIGLAPTGSADPMGLRRRGAGVVRILLEGKLSVSLRDILRRAASPFAAHMPVEPLRAAVGEFVQDRARGAFLEKGHRYDLVDAVMATDADNLLNVGQRLEAVAVLAKQPEFPQLVELVERTYNMSKALGEEAVDVRPDLLQAPEEKALYDAWNAACDDVARSIERREYADAARRYREAFAAPVHLFFEKVFVNVDDAGVRKNRLALLRNINRAFSRTVADLSKVVEGKK